MSVKSLALKSLLSAIGISTSILAHEAEVQLPFGGLHAHDEVEWHLHSGWESHYFSEGRDNLDGDSLLTMTFEFGWEHLTGGLWYAKSSEQAYDELHLSLAVVREIDEFAFYAGYTYLAFPSDGDHDHEVGAGVSWTGLPWDLELALDVYHSFGAPGWFGEVSVGREFEVTEELVLALTGVFGVNQGYVPDGHDGANHLAVRLGARYALSESLALTAHLASSWALEREKSLAGDEALTDLVHGGIGAEVSF